MRGDDERSDLEGMGLRTDGGEEPDADRATPADYEAAGVPVSERTRTLDAERFEGLRARYDAIDGVAMVGVTTDDGEVLVAGETDSAPPGGDVESGEDWEAAARRNVRELTGEAVTIDGARLVEHTEWREDGGDGTFRTTSVHFEASLADDATEFREDPTPADPMEHKFHQDPDDDGPEFRWIDETDDDLHPNHVEHVELYLD